MFCVFGTTFSLILTFSIPSLADDGPNGPYTITPELGFASNWTDQYAQMCWRDRASVVDQYLASKNGKELPDLNKVKVGAFRVSGAERFDFEACNDTDFGNLSTDIADKLYDSKYSVLFVATTKDKANTWYINPKTTFSKVDDFESSYPPYPGDSAQKHLQYFNGKKWVSMWNCNAWFTLYDRTLEDIDWIATRKSEFDIPEADVLSRKYETVNVNTLWDSLCGKIPTKPGTYTYKLRLYTPTYDYVYCKLSYSTWYCDRNTNLKKYLPLKGKIKIVKSKNGSTKVSYLSK